MRKGESKQAIKYAQKYMAPWAKDNMAEFKRAVAAMAFGPGTPCKRYRRGRTAAIGDGTAKSSSCGARTLNMRTDNHVRVVFAADRQTSVRVGCRPVSMRRTPPRLQGFVLRRGLAAASEPLPPRLLPPALPPARQPSADPPGGRAVCTQDSRVVPAGLQQGGPAAPPSLPEARARPPLVQGKSLGAERSAARFVRQDCRAFGRERASDVLWWSFATRRHPQHVHSKLVCALTHEVMDVDNPPLVLPNGRVYSTKAVQLIAARNDGNMVCPETEQVFPATEAKRLYIV